ncbi:MAG: 2,3,4,5-tetrahydropyridine-2,6-dicarboxylate N-succinyltransferase [Actinomycetes bacterium]
MAGPGYARGVGLATLDAQGNVLEAWFPAPRVIQAPVGAVESDDTPAERAMRADLAPLVAQDPRRDTRRVVVTVAADLDTPPVDVADAYLRLHLLSSRLVVPHGLNLDGLFSLLPTVVWTTRGPCAADGFEQTRLRLAADGPVHVLGVDKFPAMVDYVVPTGVRVADGARVRLGAYLAAGTTVMHEGFVNVNAGTLGPCMIEGRISAGVVVDAGSDIGGGASIMGTLSGGGRHTIRIGRECLVGANAGIGISLGDGCVVEAGLYVTAGTKVRRPDGTVVPARQLSGSEGLLFRRHSQSGAVEVLRRSSAGAWDGLNPSLHASPVSGTPDPPQPG